MKPEKTLFLATDDEAMRKLADTLDAEFVALPSLDGSSDAAAGLPQRFEAWRTEVAAGPPRARIIVAPWRSHAKRAELMTLTPNDWQSRFELPYLLWNVALGAAARRAADDGAIAGLVQAPAALEAPGWTPEFAIADGVLSLIRSVAAAEGPRGVRANLVSTPIGLVEGEVIAPAPPLPDFPGRLEDRVAGSLRLLLSADACGLTGRLLSADGGRSL